MKVGDKVKVRQQGRGIWKRLIGATGTVKIIKSHYIQLEIVIDGNVGRYNLAPNEVVELKPLKLKRFSAWR
jgi:hypothetical protein